MAYAKSMAELFGADRSVITKHLKNIFQTEELKESSMCAKIAHTAEDGKTYNTNFYRLEAVLAVGYRVNSVQAIELGDADFERVYHQRFCNGR
ncbi:MAG: hypothetical protein QM727_00400 [Niabella sp.]